MEISSLCSHSCVEAEEGKEPRDGHPFGACMGTATMGTMGGVKIPLAAIFLATMAYNGMEVAFIVCLLLWVFVVVFS